MASSILLQNATILVPTGAGDDNVVPLQAHSLLIEGNKIARIASHIEPPSDSTEIIDCTGKILCPGFIDTHHHVWQTQLKGRHADETLLEYMTSGNMQSYNYTPQDVFWGQLGGCLEAIDAGTTTVVDHAHMNYTPQHSANGISATVSSGIRSIFGYSPTPLVKTWSPLTFESLLPEWVMEQLDELAQAAPFGDGRVQLGLAFDGYFLPKETVVDLFKRVRKAGVKLITSHYVRGAIFGQHSIVEIIANHGLLDSDIVIAHACNATSLDAELLTAAKAYVSCTPDTELQMALGRPVCFRDDMSTISSLGIDCPSNNSSDIMSQMRLALQAERARRNQLLIEKGCAPKKLDLTVQDVFRLGTIQGARAVNMEDSIGSLEEGKLADIVVFDAETPAMICAAEHDPVAAIVQHGSVRDIDAVIVDGRFRKRNGKLVSVEIEKSVAEVGKTRVEWRDVAKQLLKSREAVHERTEKINRAAAEKGLIGVYGIDEKNII